MHRYRRTVVATAVLAAAGTALAGCGGGSDAKKPAASPTPTPSASSSASHAAAPPPTCPLTGLAPHGKQDRQRVALAVKVDNVSIAQPQAGIDKADVIFEETVEGGLTRLMAIFQCDSASTVGPIRSARTSDGDILRLLDGAVFAYSGANPKAIAPVRRTSHAALVAFDDSPQYFRRDPGRPMPHDVLSSTDTLLKAGLARKKHLDAPRPLFSYGPVGGRGQRAHSASMTWSGQADASWSWTGKLWARTQNGRPDTVVGGNRLAVANVVIMSIRTKNTGLVDVLGNPSPDDVVTGHGTVWVLRDGRVIRGTWHRKARKDPMRLLDGHGHVIPLHPGRTWVELLPRPKRPNIS